jgi:hypothetical protein
MMKGAAGPMVQIGRPQTQFFNIRWQVLDNIAKQCTAIAVICKR